VLLSGFASRQEQQYMPLLNNIFGTIFFIWPYFLQNFSFFLSKNLKIVTTHIFRNEKTKQIKENAIR